MLPQHELKYIKTGKRRTPYCACGWIGHKHAKADSSIENMEAAQDEFIDHLRSLADWWQT